MSSATASSTRLVSSLKSPAHYSRAWRGGPRESPHVPASPDSAQLTPVRTDTKIHPRIFNRPRNSTAPAPKSNKAKPNPLILKTIPSWSICSIRYCVRVRLNVPYTLAGHQGRTPTRSFPKEAGYLLRFQ